MSVKHKKKNSGGSVGRGRIEVERFILFYFIFILKFKLKKKMMNSFKVKMMPHTSNVIFK